MDSFDSALRELADAGHKPAAAILDGVLTSDGIIDLARHVAAELVRRTHAAGALWIADEVQSGYGRTGAAMWGYQRLGSRPTSSRSASRWATATPSPPIITRRDLAARFSDGDFFSTFGGNPVAMAAAQAVLGVIDDERIIENAADVGEYMAGRLREIASSQLR